MQKNLVTLDNALKGCQRCLGLASKRSVGRLLAEVIEDAVGDCLGEAVLEVGVF